MSAKLTADTGKRRNLRVMSQAMPLVVLRSEGSGSEHLAQETEGKIESESNEERRERKRADAVRSTLAPFHADDTQAAQSATPTRMTSQKDLPINNPQAFPELLELYQGLQKAQATSSPSPINWHITLPPPTKARTLVLDLDETLVHKQAPGASCETVLTVTTPSSSYLIGLSIRPYVSQVLTDLAKTWELIIFTASQRNYADAIIDYIDPDKRLITHRLYRDHCVYLETGAVKDLRILQHRCLSRTVIVDNSILSFAYQLSNGIPISPWRGSLKDRELLKLNRFLKRLETSDDVRVELRHAFNLEHYCQNCRRTE